MPCFNTSLVGNNSLLFPYFLGKPIILIFSFIHKCIFFIIGYCAFFSKYVFYFRE